MRCETDEEFENRKHKPEPAGAKTSKYKGVIRINSQTWVSQIQRCRKTYNLGRYTREIDAAAAHSAAEVALDEKRSPKKNWEPKDRAKLHMHKPQEKTQVGGRGKAKAQKP